MNILITAPHGLYLDYSASFVHNQARAYVQAGHCVRVVIPVAVGKKNYAGKRFGKTVDIHCVDGVQIYYVRALSLGRFSIGRFNAKSARLAFEYAMGKITEGFCPDVIHAHTLDFGSEVTTCFKKRFGCPMVVTNHGGDTFVPYNQGRKSDLKRYTEDADVVVCVSNLLRKRLEECGATAPMQIILNGFDVPQVVADVKKDPNRVIQVGNLIPRKKVDVSIQAIAELKKENEEIRFVCVGAGPERENLEQLCKALSVEDAVTFTGRLPNPEAQRRMAEATYFVMPSVHEGFGIVYMEAMAAGCVAIGTEGEGIADMIEHGVNGFLVPADDPMAIKQVIRSCTDDPEHTAEIADNGRKTARTMTWENNARQYQLLFETLIRG